MITAVIIALTYVAQAGGVVGIGYGLVALARSERW